VRTSSPLIRIMARKDIRTAEAFLSLGTSLVWQPSIPAALIVTHPKEEYPASGIRSTWVAGPAMKIVTELEQSLKKFPPIKAGTPEDQCPFFRETRHDHMDRALRSGSRRISIERSRGSVLG